MINYDLKQIRAFIFDVDGVLSSTNVYIAMDGELMRTSNVKDGYALQLAIKKGFEVAIITGAATKEVEQRYKNIGVKHIYLLSRNKIVDYNHFLEKTGLKDEQVMYCGDDIPDYEVMEKVGLPVAPADASLDIKRIAKYVSPIRSGEGVARDIIEQTLKIHGLWLDEEAFTW